MSREQVSTEFDCRRISVIVHRSASDKLAVVHLPCLFAAESYTVKERERVSSKVFNQRFVNSCLAASPSVYIYTVIRTEYLLVRYFQNNCSTECH